MTEKFTSAAFPCAAPILAPSAAIALIPALRPQAPSLRLSAQEHRGESVRDVSFNGDRRRVRAGARALAAIRNLVLYLIRSQGMSVPDTRENYRDDRAQVIALVIGRFL